jgi:hypothetical protein
MVILRSAISKKSVKDPSRFVFPVKPDIASIAETDIAIVLPQPLIAGQLKDSNLILHFRTTKN